MAEHPHLSRRALLGLIGGGVAAAVGAGALRSGLGDPAGARAGSTGRPPATTRVTTSSTTSTTTSTTTTSTTLPPRPPKFDPYVLLPGEVQPQAKEAACRVAEALTTHHPDDGGQPTSLAELENLLSVEPGDDELLASTAPLAPSGLVSRGRVVYPQLGGLDPHYDPHRASVMVVVAQHLSEPGADESEEWVVQRCLDLRLRRDGEWMLEAVADVSSDPVPPPDARYQATALRLIEHPDVDLPDSVVWDINEGVVDERVLHELVWLGDRAPISVTTCRRGHPVNVFGTGRPSAHTAGKAVDVWKVGEPVILQHADAGSVAHGLCSEMAAAGRVRNLGSPWVFGAGTFTDPVHLDHLHLGF